MTTIEAIAPERVRGRDRVAWREISSDSLANPPKFDPRTLSGLPGPAQRLLRRSLGEGTALSSAVLLEMTGEIKLAGRWTHFRADQLLTAGAGFVWAPVVGGCAIRFVGTDVLGPHDGHMEFRFHDRIPVVRADGPDVRRSAQGRLAAETVAWLPQALTPQLGARWAEVDDERAVVTLAAAGTDVDVDVEVAVDEHGQIRWLGLDRWKDSAKPPAFAPFGGTVDSAYVTEDGVRIAGSGTVGWGFRRGAGVDGAFFRYRITNATFEPFAAGTARSPVASTHADPAERDGIEGALRVRTAGHFMHERPDR